MRTNSFKNSFAKKLKELRKSRKLTQEQLAEIVGVDFRHISLIENAKSFPSCDLIEKLANAFNVSYSELFYFEENVTRDDIEFKLEKLVPLLDDKSLTTLYKIAKELV